VSRITAAIVWQSPGLLPLVALLAIAVGLGAGVLYLPQALRLRWRWRLTLLGLRLAALSALAASLLQPTFTRPARPHERAAIVVIIDHSRSMGIKDHQQRKPGEGRSQLVALADGLGLLNPGVRQRGEELSAAIAAAQSRLEELVRAHSELQYAVISGRGTSDATARRNAANAEFQAAASALAARRDKMDATSPMAKALQGLDDELRRQVPPPRRGDDDAWIASVRKALDTVAREALTFQAEADRALYYANAEVRATCDALASMSRLSLAEDALTHPGSGLLSNLPRDVPVYGFAIGGSADGAVSLPLFGPAGQPVRRLLLAPSATGVADLAATVRAALDQMGSVPVQAVVLLSDGRQVAARGGAGSEAAYATAAKSPPAVGVPVYAVAAAAPLAAPKDLSLSHVTVHSSVVLGQPFTVRARLHGVGLGGGANVVEVRCAVGRRQAVYPVGAPALIAWDAARLAVESALGAKRYTLNGASASTEVEFQLRADLPGAQPLTLDLADLEGEITAENNVVERWVKVCPRPTRVMLLATAPSWEYRYLRDAIRSTHGEFNLSAKTVGSDGSFAAIPPQQILEQDVVVLLDVPVAALSAAQQDAIYRVASDRGGGVVLATGSGEHLPVEYTAKPLVDLLPVPPPSSTAVASAAAAPPPADQVPWSWPWRTWAGENPTYRFAPWTSNSGGNLSPWSAASPIRWDALPPLYRYLPITPLRTGARPLLIERQTGETVAAEMPVGTGKAVLIGLDETWRWRYKGGTAAAAHDQVWLDLIRALADPPYAVVGKRMSLDVSRAAVSAGEAVEVRARLADDNDATSGHTPAAMDLQILRGDEVIRTQSLPATSAGRYKGTLLGLPVGDYRLEAQVGGVTAAESLSYPLHVIGQYDAELEDPSGDRESLRRIVEASGGRLLALEQMRDLPPLLAAQARQPAAVTVRLWDSSYLFVFVVACFAAEWAVRKRMGLA
jgi:hypothetical protein